MSKLDDTLAKAYEFMTQEAWTAGAKQEIKDLFIDLLGDEYEDRPEGVDRTCYRLTKSQIRKKVSEL